MYVIMVYDVNQRRINKVLNTARKYLEWIQNSVLEGEITEAKFEMLKREIEIIINEEEDSVIFYIMRTTKYSERQILGIEKNKREQIL
ncbi:MULTISPECIES: CRISPR-associated endonuclease Cas2 [Dictyoglomus]|uniref:CRISPR-associated endoribonuclease Cas2 n=1 Tax=Dictyoglomus turgidum (strain DSM 6724 / Z-1310) TaxID=515635 RepID=CAS2_DICTD|nr:CRISPR-associated endonuclease Cas2 [Dictyoglomus turgidum]B8DZH3.1 RecName: Full=CRISPR-associated endoribonuclease Cas2 [Dictyoglomus turgidum DSM 6724]ACK41906.1 CRISPR-associated protein Cas2 [Dictyoglomus turgidum DSM 6724]HBU31537.1 CRISPR-associated endonuclease Cas2 [Dictyoglomus sp.]